jgi:4-hydroxy-2-oxoheptanedioate aldolase
MKSFSDQLEQGPQLGLGIMYPACGIIERIGPDWDWIWIDGQHGELGYSDVLSAVTACNLIQRSAVVRVSGHEAGEIGKALDTAADGIMVPFVEDAEQAQKIVQASKFFPQGGRSYGGRRPIDLSGRAYAHNNQPVVICQIETDLGLKNAESIAAVDGVDALFFGPDDMANQRGLPMDEPRSSKYFNDELKAVAEAAKAHGKICGGVFPTPEALSYAIKVGYKLNVVTADVMLLANGSREKVKSARVNL